jgi:hypothetical protein
MNHSVFMLIALWSWLVVSAALVLLAGGYLLRFNDEWSENAVAHFGLVVSTGLAVCALILLRHPMVAQWTWRVLCVTAAGLGLVNLVRVIRDTPVLVDEWLPILLSDAFSVLMVICALLAPLTQSPAVLQAPVGAPIFIIGPAQIDFWHIASLTILCLGTLIFGILFVSTMQRQGSMWFETRHGGLAGNIGGWRISASVGYLAGALLFGALFGAMVMTDSGPASHGAVSEPAGTHASKSAAAAAPIPATADTGKGSSATAAH